MAEFTATIETDVFVIDVKAHIDDDGVIVNEIWFGDDPLTAKQVVHFIHSYGEADLDDEIMEQYREQCRINAKDRRIEVW